ncbi:MAG: hypothetical protein JSV93_01655, partial [Candidatus Omnitrophota bacterium]
KIDIVASLFMPEPLSIDTDEAGKLVRETIERYRLSHDMTEAETLIYIDSLIDFAEYILPGIESVKRFPTFISMHFRELDKEQYVEAAKVGLVSYYARRLVVLMSPEYEYLGKDLDETIYSLMEEAEEDIEFLRLYDAIQKKKERGESIADALQELDKEGYELWQKDFTKRLYKAEWAKLTPEDIAAMDNEVREFAEELHNRGLYLFGDIEHKGILSVVATLIKTSGWKANMQARLDMIEGITPKIKELTEREILARPENATLRQLKEEIDAGDLPGEELREIQNTYKSLYNEKEEEIILEMPENSDLRRLKKAIRQMKDEALKPENIKLEIYEKIYKTALANAKGSVFLGKAIAWMEVADELELTIDDMEIFFDKFTNLSEINKFLSGSEAEKNGIKTSIVIDLISDYYNSGWADFFNRDGISVTDLQKASVEKLFLIVKPNLEREISSYLKGGEYEKTGQLMAIARDIVMNKPDTWQEFFDGDGNIIEGQEPRVEHLFGTVLPNLTGAISGYLQGNKSDKAGQLTAIARDILMNEPDTWEEFFNSDGNIIEGQEPRVRHLFGTVLPNLRYDISGYLQGRRSDKAGQITAIAREILLNYQVWEEFFTREGTMTDSGTVENLFIAFRNLDEIDDLLHEADYTPKDKDGLKMSIARDIVTEGESGDIATEYDIVTGYESWAEFFDKNGEAVTPEQNTNIKKLFGVILPNRDLMNDYLDYIDNSGF